MGLSCRRRSCLYAAIEAQDRIRLPSQKGSDYMVCLQAKFKFTYVFL